MWGLSSVMILISSMHKSVHTPEVVINSSKTACGCPCGGATTNKNQCFKVVTHITLSTHGMYIGQLSINYYEQVPVMTQWQRHESLQSVLFLFLFSNWKPVQGFRKRKNMVMD